MAWVEQIREVEDSLIAIISLDGDVVTEALANLPADARGRLQTMLALAEEAAAISAMTGVGHHYVIDTGLGPAVYHISSEEDEDEPAAGSLQPVQSWADQPADVQPFVSQGPTQVQPLQTEVQPSLLAPYPPTQDTQPTTANTVLQLTAGPTAAGRGTH